MKFNGTGKVSGRIKKVVEKKKADREYYALELADAKWSDCDGTGAAGMYGSGECTLFAGGTLLYEIRAAAHKLVGINPPIGCFLTVENKGKVPGKEPGQSVNVWSVTIELGDYIPETLDDVDF